MDNLFLIILLLSLIALVLGIVKPKLSMPWAKAPTRGKSLGLYATLIVICFVGFGMTNDSKKTSPTPSMAIATDKAPASEPAKVAAPKPPAAKELAAMHMPDTQKGFLDVMAKAADAYSQAPNELVKSKIAKQRKVDSRKFTPKSRLQSWTGVIESLKTNGDGKAIVVIRANDMATFQTMNNAFSDIEYKTLIPQSSPLFDTLASMSAGTPVRFSGFLASEASITEQGSVENPDFIVRFDQIEALH